MQDAMRNNQIHLVGAPAGGPHRSLPELLCTHISIGLLVGRIQQGMPLYCVNDYMIEHLGYDSCDAFAAAIDGLILNTIHPEDRAQIQRKAGASMQEGLPCEVQYRMLRADGSYIWVNDVSRCAADEQGRAICISTIQDVTESVQDKRMLQKREQAYDRLFESVVCGIVQYEFTSESGHIAFRSANPEALRIFGYTPAQFAAKTDWTIDALIHPDDRASTLYHRRRLLAVGDQAGFEYRLLRRDGSPCWIIGTAELIRGADGAALVQSVFMDIDRRKRAELQNLELLQRSRMADELLRLALDGTDVNVIHYYPQRRRMVVPARTCARYGWKPLYENTPDSLADCVYPDDRSRTLTQFAEFDQHASSSREFRTGDGRSWVRVTLSAVERDADGNVTAAVGLVEDRTKQRQAESAHSALSQLNQEVLRSLDRLFFGVYRIDLRAGTIRAVRAPVEEGTNGITVEDGPYNVERLAVLYHPDDRAAICHDLSLDTLRSLQAAGERSIEREYRRLIGGEYRWVSRVVYLNHADFGSESAIVVLTDISDRRRQEDVLHALGRAYFAIYYVDLQEDTLEIMRSDPAVTGALGIGPHSRYSSVIAQYIESFVHGEDRAALSAFCSAANLRQLTPARPELSHTFRKLVDGRYEWMQLRFLLSSGGRDAPPQVTLAIRDVDEDIRQQLETKQLLADALRRAENANSAKSDFLSKMSHDIRTPMNAIIGMTALAKTNLDNPDRLRDCLDKITLSSRHLLDLINEVLDMSKIESGKLDLKISEACLPELIERTLDLIRTEAARKKLRLCVDLTGAVHTQVLCDALRLQQVLANLLSNACKYTPDGGAIWLTLTEHRSPRKGYAAFELVCRDNGVGMSEEFQTHLFEPFSRADDSRTSHISGTGLGMAIAHNLVRMMGGAITCQSAPGAGATFTVSLSLELADAPPAAPTPTDDAEVQPSLAGKRLLLVEDNALNQEIASEFLRLAGAEVITADNGQQAVERFSAAAPGAFDAILMDIRMPVMDGYTAARAIRALSHPHARSVPIIAMTADAFAEDVQHAIEAGMTAHIAKPLDIKRLLHLLSLWT